MMVTQSLSDLTDMRALSTELRIQLESAVLEGRRAAEVGVRAAMSALGVGERERPVHLNEEQACLRRGLRATQRQLGGDFDVLVWDAAYEQWHKLLFARFLAENDLLRHPEFGALVTLEDCGDLAHDLGEPDGWSVAASFAAEILPGIFRLDDPCLQLRLAPEHRIALEKIVAALPAAVFTADDSLGWVYQYWQSERRDQVNASEVKIGGADLGPVTQLFTENYMVRFLLENSLGAWWAARHPNSPLVRQFEYLRFDDDGHPAAGRFDGWPGRVAEVTVMDPCCGSGHFLVEAFGMLWRMRAEEERLDPVAAQDAVLRDNLFGLEVDPRCVQIAMFAVALTAWKQGGGWRELPTPNIACSGIPAKAPLEEWSALAKGDERLERALERLHTLFKEADTLGSLINPRRAAESADPAKVQRSLEDLNFEQVAPLLERAATGETNDPATAVLGADAAGIARAADLLSRSYTVLVTNVPYLSQIRFSQTLTDFAAKYHHEARADLATLFLHRFSQLTARGGAHASVSLQNWLYLSSFRAFRRHLLDLQTPTWISPLGPGAFDAIGGEIVKVVLMIAVNAPAADDAPITGTDPEDLDATPSAKSRRLAQGRLLRSTIWAQRQHPDQRFTLVQLGSGSLLWEFAESSQGICTGDYPRFGRRFWELPMVDGLRWVRQQSTPESHGGWSGCRNVLLWERGHGSLLDFIEQRLGSGREGAWIRGVDFRGSQGITITQAGSLDAGFYTGELFDNNTVVIVAQDDADFPAIAQFLMSSQFRTAVRRIDTNVRVADKTMLKVPFEVERWRQVAEECGPIAEPWSNDPSQWLFEGGPEAATESLQVAVALLVGYRWPEQDVSDGLGEPADDDDGIICLPAVAGEQPASNRLQTLLARAYGDRWSSGLSRQLLEQSGSKKRDLAEWLRDDFFSHHCSVFAHRPFVWHIWDGRKDGFSSVVNYHRLDRAGLEKLTYTYLGDWIERQRADAVDDVAGADLRLAAAQDLKGKLEAILKGEPPFDIYVRWKELHKQPIGWEPDLDDGVRLNIRPFVEAGVLRSKVKVHWKKDRGRNPDGSERHNDLHYTIAEKHRAREKASRP